MKQVRERRCVATGETGGEDTLLRVALSPDKMVVPDLAARLPGRGAWVSAQRDLVERAVNKGLFNRAFGEAVQAPQDLADQFEAQLAERTLSRLGLSRRAGRLAIGYDASRLALMGRKALAWRIEASDGARDGRAKLDGLTRQVWPGLKTVGCFLAEELGQAVGRGSVVHAVLLDGPEASGFKGVISKLAGFRVINPFEIGAQDG